MELFEELTDTVLEAVVGGASPLGNFVGGISDSTGVAGQGAGSTINAGQTTANTAIDTTQSTVGIIGIAAYDFEQSLSQNL